MKCVFCVGVQLLTLTAQLAPGTTTEQDVMAKFGQPLAEQTLPEGNRILDF